MKKFTLLELLIVVAVIGILLTILIPTLSKAREKAYTAVCMSNLKQISIGLSLYLKNSDGEYPPGQPNFTHYTGDGKSTGFRAVYNKYKFRGPGMLLPLEYSRAEIHYCPKEIDETGTGITGTHGLKTMFPDDDYTKTPDSFSRSSYHYQGNFKEMGEAGWGRTIKPSLHPSNAVLMAEHFANFISEEYNHGKRLNLLYLDGSVVSSIPPVDIKTRVNNVLDWDNINMALRRMDRAE